MSRTPTRGLLDSIRRTIEERNLFSARSRLHFVSALQTANYNGSSSSRGKDSKNFKSPLTGRLMDNRLIRLRNKAIQEIIKTEEVYVSQLRTIRREFMEDTEIKICLSRRDFNVLFGNILTLLEVNEKLLQELKGPAESCPGDDVSESNEAVGKDAEVGTLNSVAEAFHNYTPYLKLYSLYASGYQQADTLLQKLMSQCPELRNLVKVKEEKLNNTLQSYLITPIQRIPRYKLLLQHLIGFIGTAGKNDPDVQSLLESIKNLEQVAIHMNEMIRQHENSCKLLEINMWMGKFYHGNLVEPGRNFIKAGSVLKPPTTMLQHSLTANNQFYLVLLSDQIISCKIKSELGSKGCLQPSLVLPLKKSWARIVDDLFAEVECEDEFIRFTLTDPDDLIEWVRVINESAKALKKRSATLKKPSSNVQPIRREQIKNILRANKKGTKRPASENTTPSSAYPSPGVAPSPGKLRRFLNISDRLDELVNYLSPIRTNNSPRRTRRSMASAQATAYANSKFDSSPQFDYEEFGRLKLTPVSKFSNSSCTIL